MNEQARERLIAIAKSYVGTTGDVPAFHDLLGPQENGGKWPLNKAYGKGGISTCAVVGRGFLRKLGIPLGPYVTASGLDDAIAYAKSKDAWRTDKGRPDRGAMVELQGETSIHVLTVISVEPIAGSFLSAKITSVDGGQVAANGLQTITTVTRVWTPGLIGNRRIVGWIDPAVEGFAAVRVDDDDKPPTSKGGVMGALAALAFGVWLWTKKKK